MGWGVARPRAPGVFTVNTAEKHQGKHTPASILSPLKAWRSALWPSGSPWSLWSHPRVGWPTPGVALALLPGLPRNTRVLSIQERGPVSQRWPAFVGQLDLGLRVQSRCKGVCEVLLAG